MGVRELTCQEQRKRRRARVPQRDLLRVGLDLGGELLEGEGLAAMGENVPHTVGFYNVFRVRIHDFGISYSHCCTCPLPIVLSSSPSVSQVQGDRVPLQHGFYGARLELVRGSEGAPELHEYGGRRLPPCARTEPNDGFILRGRLKMLW